MSFNAAPSFLDIDATRLSPRARALFESRAAALQASAGRAPAPGDTMAWFLLAMPAWRLQRFADHLGMLGAGTVLRQVLDGQRSAAWRLALGAGLYAFGILRAPLIGTLPLPPGCLGEPDGAAAAVRHMGLGALRAFCATPGEGDPLLRSRLSGRVEQATEPGTPLPAMAAPGTRILQRLLRETDPVLATALPGMAGAQ